MIIDFHTHAFPEKISEKAMKVLSLNAGNAIPFHNGTAPSLAEYVRKSGADKAVVLNIATNPHQQTSVNNFAISLLDDSTLIPFGSVHPDSENAFEELERLKKAGIKGIKLHPDYQNFFVDDEKLFPLYKKIGELGFITVFHAGVDIEYFEPVHCTPDRLARALKYFGGAPVVAAHWGGYMKWYEVEEHLIGRDIYLVTSYAYGRMPREQAKRMAEHHGAEKILFGSDMPWSGTDNEMRFIDSLGLTDSQKAAILGENGAKLLGV